MKINCLKILFLVLLSPLLSKAQYESNLQPYPQRYAAVNKLAKIQLIEVRKAAYSGDTLDRISYIDTNGYEILITRPTKRKVYLLYDSSFRLIRQIDSNLVANSSEEIQVTYDSYKKLSFLRFPNQISSFKYNPIKKELYENYQPAKGKDQRRFYKYDRNDNLNYEFHGTYEGKPFFEKYLKYDKNGFLIEEKIKEKTQIGTKDFRVSSFTYNDLGFLKTKFIIHYDNYADSALKADGSIYNTTSYDETFQYFYDGNNNEIKMTYSNSKQPEINYSFIRTFNKDNTLARLQTLDKNDQETFWEQYIYHKYGESKVEIPKKIGTGKKKISFEERDKRGLRIKK